MPFVIISCSMYTSIYEIDQVVFKILLSTGAFASGIDYSNAPISSLLEGSETALSIFPQSLVKRLFLKSI